MSQSNLEKEWLEMVEKEAYSIPYVHNRSKYSETHGFISGAKFVRDNLSLVPEVAELIKEIELAMGQCGIPDANLAATIAMKTLRNALAKFQRREDK